MLIPYNGENLNHGWPALIPNSLHPVLISVPILENRPMTTSKCMVQAYRT
jgi:hypothetical protein